MFLLGAKIRDSLETESDKAAFNWHEIVVQASRGNAMSRLIELTGIPLEEMVKNDILYHEYYDFGGEKLAFILDKINFEISKTAGQFEEI